MILYSEKTGLNKDLLQNEDPKQSSAIFGRKIDNPQLVVVKELRELED